MIAALMVCAMSLGHGENEIKPTVVYRLLSIRETSRKQVSLNSALRARDKKQVPHRRFAPVRNDIVVM
jgi:hypothetical protein